MPVDPSIILAARPPQPIDLPQAMQQAMQLRALGQEQQLRQAQITDVQAQTAERQQAAQKAAMAQQQSTAVDDLMQHAMTVDPQTGVATFDRALFQKGLVQGGMGHLYPQMVETLDKLDESATKIAAEKRQMLARSLFAVQQAGNTPDAVNTAAAYLKANGAITDDHLQPVLQAVQANPTPENIGGIMTRLGSGLSEYQDLVNADAKRKADLAHTEAQTNQANAAAEKDRADAGTPKPPTAPQLEARAQELYAKKTLFQQHVGPPLTAAESAELTGYEEARHNPDVAAQTAQVHQDALDAKAKQAQTDSYKFHTEQVKPIAAPVMQKNDEIGNLYTLMNQHTPQADADVAPKLLSLFAGGPGTGLRMNQATIDRNAGGHTAWVGLEQTLNKFSTDPTHASIPEAQRQQIYQLLGSAQGQVKGKLDAIQSFQNVLADPNSTEEQHRKGFVGLQKKLGDLEQGEAVAGTTSKPDVSGLRPGMGRKFNAGAFAGQTWTVGPNGDPVRVN